MGEKLGKKLWRATNITDRWTSTSIYHGNTPHIPDGSFDTSDLNGEDMYDGDVASHPDCDIL